MEVFFLIILSQLLVYGDIVDDPVHAGWIGRTHLREQECERMSQAEAHQRYPGAVPAPQARAANIFEIDALSCRPLVVARGAREAQDEVLLARLSRDVDALVGLAVNAGDDESAFVVEAFHPDIEMVRKIATAARVSLAERGRRVSDAPPRLTAGDVEVLRTMPVRDALPVACRRLHRMGALTDDDGRALTFISVALVHPRESELHAGVCREGTFRWIR